jgi:hypothetical protein
LQYVSGPSCLRLQKSLKASKNQGRHEIIEFSRTSRILLLIIRQVVLIEKMGLCKPKCKYSDQTVFFRVPDFVTGIFQQDVL